jgi:hypothetical protein
LRTGVLALIVRSTASLGLVMFLAYIGLQFQFRHTRVTVKEPDLRRVHPLDVHGHVVYLTYGESRTLSVLSWGGGGLLLFAGVAGVVLRRRPSAGTTKLVGGE